MRLLLTTHYPLPFPLFPRPSLLHYPLATIHMLQPTAFALTPHPSSLPPRLFRYTALMAGGIVFLRTAQFEAVKSFYLDRVGMTVWIEQPDISILRFSNLLIGFCDHPEGEIEGVLTFFYDTREEVDAMYAKLSDIATAEPKENTKYRIYNFFGTDPEGRTIEFQCFLHPLPRITDD